MPPVTRSSGQGIASESRHFGAPDPRDHFIAADSALPARRDRYRSARAVHDSARGRAADQRADGRYPGHGAGPVCARCCPTCRHPARDDRQERRWRRARLHPGRRRWRDGDRALPRGIEPRERRHPHRREAARQLGSHPGRYTRAQGDRARDQRCSGGCPDAIAQAWRGWPIQRSNALRACQPAADRDRQSRQCRTDVPDRRSPRRNPHSAGSWKAQSIRRAARQCDRSCVASQPQLSSWQHPRRWTGRGGDGGQDAIFGAGSGHAYGPVGGRGAGLSSRRRGSDPRATRGSGARLALGARRWQMVERACGQHRHRQAFGRQCGGRVRGGPCPARKPQGQPHSRWRRCRSHAQLWRNRERESQ